MTARILTILGTTVFFTAACGRRAPSDRTEIYRGAPIVFVSVDTLRADRVGAYGAAEPATPHLDALRRKSLLFADATSPCPLTLPAHVSLLSGLLPPEHGVRDNVGYRITPARPWLPRVLKQQGYATGAAVSAHVLRAGTGMDGSFDFYDDRVGDLEGSGALREAERPGAATAQIALDWIGKNRDKPFFFLLHLYEPHSPYEPPEPFRSRHRSPYDGEVAAADQVVGDFLSALERLGLHDEALIVFLSDHGEGLGQHGEEEHGVLLYREALRIPLLVKLPGGKRAGETVSTPVGLADVFPMVAGLIGADLPAGLRASAILAGSAPAEAPAIYAETYYPRLHLGWSHLRSLWNGRHHFIDGPRPELYDLREDPLETKNLFSPSSEPARALKRQLDARGDRFSGPGPADAEDLRKLASLGYLTLSGEAFAGGPLPNPAERVSSLAEAGKAFRLAAGGGPQGRDRRAREDPPGQPALLRRPVLAELLAEDGRLGEAEKAFQEAIALSPGLAGQIALDLAKVHLRLGKLSEAEQEARLGIPVAPAEAHAILAEVALAREDPARALEELDRASQAAGGAPASGRHFLRGEALARMGRHAEAIAAFREEIRARPSHSEAYARLAILSPSKDGKSARCASFWRRCTPGIPGERRRCSPRRRSPPSATPMGPPPGSSEPPSADGLLPVRGSERRIRRAVEPLWVSRSPVPSGRSRANESDGEGAAVWKRRAAIR
ncbi:MAG: sulfatase-like hydrolase/transferase [Thermoanaerobaculia bacterium]